ncbi:MAG: kynureninase [Xanthomonadales bacterium]|nr:Kynureninase [Xanthomonadales bacterium]MCC6593072.1 kynureninase [Xanthomonadales bacterium]MCE7930376.1 kynureninase [Xanthomonadales bacterium PRO6]
MATSSIPSLRAEFAIPQRDGRDLAYFCGNSLGLMPRATPGVLERVIEQWRTHAVEAHFTDADAWMPYHELVREGLARLAGAQPSEVVAMNSLTANLHLMMVGFYRPSAARRKILIEARAFPSDRHAVVSQIRFHGGDPAVDLIELAPLPGAHCIAQEQIDELLARQGEQIALVLWPGVQYATGQRFELARIAALAHRHGCTVGFDLAHALGNVPVDLHAADADFAVWCSYKYLNAGPGAIAGCFVHERHARADLPRFAGWWGHQQGTRFLMGAEFQPTPGAEGWQLSNPSIFSLAPLRASLALFDRVGLPALRARSLALTGWLADAIAAELHAHLEILTPGDPQQRGCQLSLRVRAGRAAGRRAFERLSAQGIVCDWREPDVIRAAPVPLYNEVEDCRRLCDALLAHFETGSE